LLSIKKTWKRLAEAASHANVVILTNLQKSGDYPPPEEEEETEEKAEDDDGDGGGGGSGGGGVGYDGYDGDGDDFMLERKKRMNQNGLLS